MAQDKNPHHDAILTEIALTEDVVTISRKARWLRSIRKMTGFAGHLLSGRSAVSKERPKSRLWINRRSSYYHLKSKAPLTSSRVSVASHG